MSARPRLLTLAAYLACIVGANASLDHWGMILVFGTMLPAGVWFAGASFTMRDILDEEVFGTLDVPDGGSER